MKVMHKSWCMGFFSSMAYELAKHLFGLYLHGNKESILYWEMFPSLEVLTNKCAL